MIVNGFLLDGDWKVSNVGFTAKATYGGKRYFLKKYGCVKMPRHDASTNAKTYARLERVFNEFKSNRIAINEALSDIAVVGGNIILPTKWFIDDICYVEATEFVPNLIEDEEILALPMDQLLFVMLTAAGSLKNIHSKNIIHSDLKRTNILAAKNSSGRIVAKIIDFDKSYFVGHPMEDELGGDQAYMSPELSWCLMTDLAEESLACLSTKSDIFSLGVVFYNYLTKGEFPETIELPRSLASKSVVYCGEALALGAKLRIGKKIKEPYLQNLLANMLQKDPDKRPTAQQVLDTLKNKRVEPLAGDSVEIAGGVAPAPARPAPTPTPVPSRPAPTPAPAPAPAPTPTIPVGFCELWEEHAGISLNLAKVEATGYVASERLTKGSTKCYAFYRADGTKSVLTTNTFKLLGWLESGTASTPTPARPAPAPAPTPAPTPERVIDNAVWEKDSAYVIDGDKAVADGYKGISRGEKNGRQGYFMVKPDGSAHFVLIQQLTLLGYARKK